MDNIFFKTDKEREQWERLDPRVRGVLLVTAEWQVRQGWPGITITCIIRTTEENAAVGGRAQSAHVMDVGQIWARAVDIRNNDLTVDQQRQRRDFIATHWNWRCATPMIYLLDHDSGHGAHTHINLNLAYRM